MILLKKFLLSIAILIVPFSGYTADPDTLSSYFHGLEESTDSLEILAALTSLEQRASGGELKPELSAKQYQLWAGFFQEKHNFRMIRKAIDRSNHYARLAGDSSLVIKNQFVLAELLMEEDNRAFAIALLDRVLKSALEVGDSISILQSLRMIANNYDYLGDHTLALDYYAQCIEIAQQVNDLAVLSRVYGNMAGIYCEDGAYEKSIETYEMALPIALASNNYESLFNIYQGLGIAYDEEELFNEAHIYLKKCHQLALDEGDERLEGFALQSFGYYFYGLKMYDSAELYMNKTRAVAEKISNSQLYINALEVLQEIAYKTGRYREAYDLFRKLTALHDSAYNLKNTRLIQSIKSEYQTEKKERELAEKNLLLTQAEYDLVRKSNFQTGLITFLILVIIITFLVYRGYILRKRSNEQLRLRNAQIQSYSRKLEDVSETKNRWFINVAHELRTPLTLIKAPVKQLLKKEELDDQVKEELEMIERNTSQLVDTVNEILDLSKMEEGKMQLNVRPTNMRHLIDEVINAFAISAKYSSISLNSWVQKKIVMHVDGEKLYKLLANLISNALKYTAEGGEILIKLEVKDHVEITVSDTGEGIDQVDLPYIFDRFYQTADQMKRAQGGTGIGLSLSKEIAELHSGTITVESTPGQGSTFTLRLPKELIGSQEDAAVAYATPADQDKSLQIADILDQITEKPQLLLVEDNDDLRKFVSSLLERDFHIVQARNGHEALAELAVKKIKFIISDVMMPGMDGTSFLREVKANDQWSRLPFIHLSAYASEDQRKTAFQIGIDDYLQKPFDPEELMVRVHNLYRNYLNRVGENNENEISFDDKIIKMLRDDVISNLDDANFNVWRLADRAAMSERQIYRFLKKQTGLTPHQFIQEIKLAKAMELIQKKVYPNVNQVAHAVGFQQGSYFSTVFEKRFGRKPITLMKA